MARARAFCFTLNNYTTEEVQTVKDWECKYLIFGKEVGESGTPHLQGYVYFENAKTLSVLKKKFSNRAHWEIARGTPKQASEYCEKDGDVFEKGERPEDPAAQGIVEKRRWEDAYKAVAEGRLEDVPKDILCTRLKAIEYAVQRVAVTKRKLDTLDELEHEWFVGPPGTGKSRAARQENPGAYIKDPTQNWWDGYLNEEVVIIDDFDKFQVKQGGDMKRWLDRYAFQAPIKGGYSLIRPRKVVVTSNYHPSEIWDDSVTVEAITRRVRVRTFPPTQRGGAGGACPPALGIVATPRFHPPPSGSWVGRDNLAPPTPFLDPPSPDRFGQYLL